MSIPPPEAGKPSRLRFDAESRLEAGSAPPTSGWPAGVAALGLIHKLASEPGSADDALKLLHELQVHQVELDLQHEQLEGSRRELGEELDRYRALFELAPVAYLCAGAQGEILEANLAAAELFGISRDDLPGRRIDTLLAPESRPVLQALRQRQPAGGGVGECLVQTAGRGARPMQLMAGTRGDELLLMLVDAAGRGQSGPRA